MALSRKAALGVIGSAAAAFVAVAPGTAHADDGLFGSLAMSVEANGDVLVGWGADYSNWSDSDARALRECGNSRCQVVVQFNNACGAIARNGDGKLGRAWGKTRAEAERLAVADAGPVNMPLINLGSSAPKAPKILASECTSNAR
ncbi:DUF4189 domain-containing protein [Nocardia sp. NPDC052566]|uniref:DUF4189 domain-containing protein n=1 Tax=Nocardia sp. NPDC052566 TaxID=3364330 RepID=UPI0037C5D714